MDFFLARISSFSLSMKRSDVPYTNFFILLGHYTFVEWPENFLRFWQLTERAVRLFSFTQFIMGRHHLRVEGTGEVMPYTHYNLWLFWIFCQLGRWRWSSHNALFSSFPSVLYCRVWTLAMLGRSRLVLFFFFFLSPWLVRLFHTAK